MVLVKYISSTTYRDSILYGFILYYTSCSSLVKKNSKGPRLFVVSVPNCVSRCTVWFAPHVHRPIHMPKPQPRAGPRYVCHSELLLYSCINAPEGGVPTWHTHKIMGRTAQLLYTHPGHTPVSLCREEYEGKANTFLGTVGWVSGLASTYLKANIKWTSKVKSQAFRIHNFLFRE